MRIGTMDIAITLGVEEEFFLVDPHTRDLLTEPDPDILAACERRSGPHHIVPEFLRSQIETNTRVCASVAEVREALVETRRLVIESAARHGAAVIASSTHPFASWTAQTPTPKERYQRFAATYQESVRRLLIGGMHIHAGFGSPDERIRVMTAMRRYLPLLHALSASSPFNAGHLTGFKSYRLNMFGVLPRTSLPAPLYSRAQYDWLVKDYRQMDFIQDGSELWWDIRPAHAHPTVELRICDICPRIDDAVCIAALYASLIRMLLRQARAGQLPAEPRTEIIAENRWLAQRYGVFASLGDSPGHGRVDIDEYAEALVERVSGDARALGCHDDLLRVPAIVREGTSADRQIDLYRLQRLDGATEAEALRSIVDLAIAETRQGVTDAEPDTAEPGTAEPDAKRTASTC